MDFSLVFLLAAFGGGVFGASIGGQPAFIFTGFMVMIGVANSLAGGGFDFLGNVAFGPVFGPHISFAGGAAAAAFAARRGVLESGRDIGTPLAGTKDPMVLVVGGLFGMGGYLVNAGLASVLTLAGVNGGDPIPLTDTVALTVGISAIAARLMFSSTGLFGIMEDEDRERGRLVPGGAHVWVEHQQNLLQSTMIGLGAGLLSGYVVATFTEASADFAAGAGILMFGVSAVSLILLQFGLPGPVTHHGARRGSRGRRAGGPSRRVLFQVVPYTRRHARGPAGVRDLHDGDGRGGNPSARRWSLEGWGCYVGREVINCRS